MTICWGMEDRVGSVEPCQGMGGSTRKNQLLRRACRNAARLLLKQKGTEGKVW